MTAPRDPRGNLLLTCSGYCALCRETLPDPQARYVPPPNDAWKYKVVGLYNIGDTGMPPFIVALLGDLHTDSLPSKELVVNFGVRRQYSTIKVSLKYRSDKDRIAHIVHLACWNLIKKLDPKLTRRSIYEFAESTYSLFNTIHVPEGQDIKTEGFTGAVNENSSRTDLGELLNHVSRLPLELQIQISDECPSNLLSSLVAVARTSSTVVSAFKSGRGQRYIELISHSEVKTLCAKFVSIFGNKYISSLGFNEPNEDSGTVLVKASEITGIKFAIGRYGIKALRICYASNELSEWLGDPRDGWLGVIYGSDIGRLRILCDDLKYIRIDFMHNSPVRNQPRLLLDKDLTFTIGDNHRILDTMGSPPIRNFPGWRTCSYLPFFGEKSYISSLTMYSNSYSITGMVASGQSLTSIGGCGDHRRPIHLFLRPGERIASIWLRIGTDQSNSWHKPIVMVLTSSNRTHVFGSSLVDGSGFDEAYEWTQLNDDLRSMPIGIFFDVLAREGTSQAINNIGLTQRIKSPKVQGIYPMIPSLRDQPHAESAIFVNCFLTIARFADIKELKVRRIGSRVSGISVDHHDGSIDVLGEWSSLPTYCSSKIEQIYHHNDGTLTSIAFEFPGISYPECVDNISVTIDHKPRIEDAVPESKLVEVFPVSEVDPPTIMWSSMSDYDHVMLWDGEYVPPRMSSKKRDIIEFETGATGREQTGQ